MTQQEVQIIQFWLDTTHRDITITERMLEIKLVRDKLIRMLDADIEANEEACSRQWSDKRWKIINMMISIRDRLISDYA